MKCNVLIVLVFLLLYSCSPRIVSHITNAQPALPDTAFVLVIQLEDKFDNDGISIGELKSSDNGFSVNCTYDQVIDELKTRARQSGANVLKITDHIKAGISTQNQPGPRRPYANCDKITASLYKVESYKKYEKEIVWSADRKLTWDDFKSKTNGKADSTVAAETATNIDFRVIQMQLEKVKIYVIALFNCDNSWVLPQDKNNSEILQHEQLHFDITELYARKLREAIADDKSAAKYSQKHLENLYDMVSKEWENEQDRYDLETIHGTNDKKQNEWNNFIAIQLYNVKDYSR